MSKKKTIHVLSNTHWDREWRFPLQETRLHLVELIDYLLDLMEKKPDYKYYNFDSQTIFLEDYLEYRPENRKRIEKLVSDGRLIIGPWFTLPEEYCVAGESLVRNLLTGRRIGDSFGKTSKVGYTPTSYGQISQMAQLYDGFDIDGIIFYRGIHASECTNEYYLESPDGTRILGIRLSRHVSRGAFFLYISRRTMHNNGWMGYQWGEEDCLPFHLCRADEDHEEEPRIIRSPYKKTCNMDPIEEGVNQAMEDILAEATTDCLVLFDGMDSTFPNENIPEILEKASSVNPDWKFIHSSLPNFLEDLKSQIDPDKVTVLKGERRHPSPDNMFNAFLKDSISSRMYIKQRNAEVERTLTRWAEPFSCFNWISGAKEYPLLPLRNAWKYLLSNHPHDSIAGLSPDQIHKDMMSRFDQADIIAQGIIKYQLGEIAAQIDTSDGRPEDVFVTVFNPLPFEVDAAPTVYVDFPREKEYRALTIFDDKDEKVKQQIISREDSYLISTEPNEIPNTFFTTKWKLAFQAEKLPALGFKTFKISPDEGKTTNYGTQLTSHNSIENEFLKVTIKKNGTLKVLDKKSGQLYSDLLYFEDAGEWGDPWTRMVPHGDIVYNTLGASADIKLIQDGPVLTTFEIGLKWALPIGVDQATKTRLTDEKDLFIKSRVTLMKGVPRLLIDVDIDNTVKNHRLRAMFNSGFLPENAFAGGQFDVLKRNVHLPDTSDWLEPYTGTNPHTGFVCVENGTRGLAALSFGLTEYEVFDNESGAVALTLIRSYGYPKMSGLGREDRVIRVGNEDSQCLGKQSYRLGLYFYEGTWEKSGVLRQDNEQKYPPIPAHHSRYKGVGLSRCESFLKLSPDNLCLTAVKQGEDGKSVVVRLYNPTGKKIKGKLWSRFSIKKASMLKLSEDHLEDVPVSSGNTVEINVPGKKIITLGLNF